MTDKNKARVGVLVSGGGTNLQAILDAQKSGVIHSGEICLVLSNKQDAFALTRAERAGVPTAVVCKKDFPSQQAFEEEIARKLDGAGIGLIVLAGFMSILSRWFTDRYAGRIINVHPSLIPSFCGEGFYGLRVHQAALQKGVKVTGATVHYVNEIPDGGEIIAQKAVEVLPDDTPETLQRRVMEQAEWIILPKAVETICAAIVNRSSTRRSHMKIMKQLTPIYGILTPEEWLSDNTYPGRGIVIGKTPDGTKAMTAYFIMGRSENSRNRVFVEKDGEIFTEPFDAAKVQDPSLIIYAAVRQYENHLIVTNGNQTDTIYDGLQNGLSFSQALESREFEPDKPNYTPRISGMLTFENGDFTYQMSILKSADEEGTACNRYTFRYAPLCGLGHFLHTYVCDGNPIPTFQGEPERMAVSDDIDEMTGRLWSSLNEANRISLYVRYIDLKTGKAESRLINKNH